MLTFAMSRHYYVNQYDFLFLFWKIVSFHFCIIDLDL